MPKPVAIVGVGEDPRANGGHLGPPAIENARALEVFPQTLASCAAAPARCWDVCRLGASDRVDLGHQPPRERRRRTIAEVADRRRNVGLRSSRVAEAGLRMLDPEPTMKQMFQQLDHLEERNGHPATNVVHRPALVQLGRSDRGADNISQCTAAAIVARFTTST
jgi:hypothetical protein